MNDVKCPYCNGDMELNHEDGSYYGASEDDRVPTDCTNPSCEKVFLVRTRVSFDFDTECAENEHDFEKGTGVYPDSDFMRRHECVGEAYYWLKCSREECDEGRHFSTKEEYDAHPARIVEKGE